MKQLVVNADDFGICAETNLAIEMASQRGILTSASLMPNGPAYEHAVQTILPRCQGLGVGVHLVLTTGRSVRTPAEVPLLVDESGRFRRHFAGLLALCAGPRAADARRQIELELAAQFERVTGAGVRIDHIDSHQHVHMIPSVWRIVAGIAAGTGRAVVRLAHPAGREHPGAGRGLHGSLVKRLVLAACAGPTRRLAPELPADGLVVRHPDRMETAMDAAGMNRGHLERRLAALTEGVTEIVTHPSLASMSSVAPLAGNLSREDLMFLTAPGRRQEVEALMDPGMRALLAEHGITLTSFGAASAPAARPSSRKRVDHRSGARV
jgi:predicted glycoside hydrolase/deacetylase ChbG (UPF0249 family)